MRAMANNPDQYRFNGAESVQINRDMQTPEERFIMINEFFALIDND